MSIFSDSVIFKYKLQLGKTTIDLPEPHKVLHAGVQDDEIYVWILHGLYDESYGTIRPRDFYTVGTGHNISSDDLSNWTFIRTVLQGAYVWHIFANWRHWEHA